MKTPLRMLVTFTITFSFYSEADSLSKKFPYALLTSHYGILNSDDLGIDAWRGIPKQYEPEGFNGGYPYWQCFPINIASVHYSTWRDSHPMGRSDVIVTMCSLEFIVETPTEIHHYVGRRAVEVELCKFHEKHWNEITRGQDFVCFNGYGGEIDKDNARNQNPLKKSKIWTWDRIKTKKGCHSYFDGYCTVEYWRKSGYRN